MARAEHDIVRQAVEAWNREDTPSLLAVLDPDLEFIPLKAKLDLQAYRGHEGMRRFIEDMREEWEYLRLEIDEMRDGAGGEVVILGRFHNKTRMSGVEVDVPVGWVIELEDGLVRRWETFTAQEEALAAGGIPA